MKPPISIFWFRQDLRLEDNPGLIEASRLGTILPIYILDNRSQSPFSIGSAGKLYLHRSLESLNQSLNNRLNVYFGDPTEIIFRLIRKYSVKNIFWNRCYEPERVLQDAIIKKMLDDLNINHDIFNGSYLWTPEQIKKEDGSYYKIFSAYKKKTYLLEPDAPLPKPKNLILIKDRHNKTRITDLQLITGHSWENKIMQNLSFGENAAHEKLNDFVRNRLSGYKESKDYPGSDHTSKLSVNLHFGEISPRQIWKAVNSTGKNHALSKDVSHFLNEIIWREFSCYLLYRFKKLPFDNFQSKFNDFPWKKNSHRLLDAWKTGHTGIPIVDAGMRELWQTGYMHNRVRMIVASFLVKNLMIHWHCGQDWFWNRLLDADLANNSMNWQWVAGCGVDASPYFRIFNPVIQGEKFDKDGLYTKKYLPELERLPRKYLFKPWTAPEKTLNDAAIVLKVDYPKPIIDLQISRERSLAAYKLLSRSNLS